MSATYDGLSGMDSQYLDTKYSSELLIYVQRLTREKTAKIIDSLPSRIREVILLYYFEQLSRKQIAALLQICPGTVHNRLHRGLWLMKTQFAKKPKNPV